MDNDSSGPSRPTALQIEEARSIIQQIVDAFADFDDRFGYDEDRLEDVFRVMLTARTVLMAAAAPAKAPHIDPRELDCFLRLYWLIIGRSIAVLRRRAKQISSRRGVPIDDDIADREAGRARDWGYDKLQAQYNGEKTFAFDPKQRLLSWVFLLVGNGRWSDGGRGGAIGEFLKREARHPQESLDEEEGPSLDIVAVGGSPEDAAERKERLARVLGRLRQRPFDERLAISAVIIAEAKTPDLRVVDTVIAGAFSPSEKKKAMDGLIDILHAYELAQRSRLPNRTIFFAAGAYVHKTHHAVRRWVKAYREDITGESDSMESA